MNRTGIVSSVGGTLVLGALLLRNVAPSSPPTSMAPGAQPKASPTAARLTKAAKREAGTTAGKRDDRLSEDGPWSASQAHFAGAEPGRGCPSEVSQTGNKKSVAALNGVNLLLQGDEHGQSINNPRSELWCIPDSERIEAIIAIAPDPTHTHLALMFDRAVEAIQLAAQSEDYVADRYWLPWDVSSKTDWRDYDSQQTATGDQKQNEKQPGLLLFRWNGRQENNLNGQNKNVAALYVFLVTDSSTAGINGVQFSNAVDYVREVCTQPRGCAGDGAIHILGPTFSGSLDSLRRLAAAKSPQRFTAYSGTVSSTCAQEDEHLLDQPSSHCPEYPGYKAASNLRFRSLVSSTEVAVAQFIDMLKADHDVSCEGASEVAILSEASTAYGGATSGVQADKEADRSDPCYTSFVYPREIASLRNAHQATQSPADGAATNAGSPGSPYLSLQLTDQSNGGDEPPDFSNPQGPLSKEAVLMNYAAEMRRDHYRYIGISSTNVLDALFLSKFLRTAVPDARLFIVNSDLMFERELDNSSYLGALAITTYPLIQRWDWTGAAQRPIKLPLADQLEQGQYNAGVYTISEVLAYQSKNSPAHGMPLGCGEACSQADLPLWLSAVGTGGYWPVQMFPPDKGGTVQPPQNLMMLRNSDFSTAWKAVCVLLCVLAWLHVLVLLTSSPVGTYFRELAYADALPEQKLFFVNVASASLTLALGMLARPLFWQWNVGPLIGLIGVAVCVSMMALFATCVGLHLCLIWRSQWERKQGKKSRPVGRSALVSAIVWAGALGMAVLWWILFTGDASYYGLFFAYRTVHLANGVSPVLPMLLLLAVVYLWSIFEIWRLRFNEQSRPQLRIKSRFPGAPVAGHWAEGDISRALQTFLLNNGYLAGFLVTYLLWLLALDPLHPFNLFERPFFGRIYELLLGTVVLMMLSKGFRLGQVWAALRALLLELDRSPIRDAFGRLKGFRGSPIWRLQDETAEWARSLQALRYLGKCDRKLALALEPPEPPPDRDLKAIHEDVRRILKDHGDGKERSTLRTKLDGRRLELNEIKKTMKADDACRRARFEAVQSELDAVSAVLTLPDAVAKTEAEVGKTLKIVTDMRKHRGWFYLSREVQRWRSTISETESGGGKRFEDQVHALQGHLAHALNQTLAILYFHRSQPDAEDVETDESEKQEQVVVNCNQDKADEDTAQIRHLEEFTALRYTAFIRTVLSQLRHAIIFLAISFSLVLLSLNVYTFEPHQALIWSFTAIFAIIGFIILVVLMQVHRDPILSRITGTQPNELGLSFFVRIVSIGALPLLTLLSAHFPAIGHSLVSFLQPGLEALK